MQHQHFRDAAQWWVQIRSEDSMALSEFCKSGKSSEKLLGWESSPTGAPSAGNQISDLLNSFLDLETPVWRFPTRGSWKCPRSGSDVMQARRDLCSRPIRIMSRARACARKRTPAEHGPPRKLGAPANRPTCLVPDARFATVDLLSTSRTLGRLMHTVTAGDS
jgi:hypothetical protein